MLKILQSFIFISYKINPSELGIIISERDKNKLPLKKIRQISPQRSE
jgi:hypothetical protein